ncbi:MAG: hypothetical protein NTY06_03955 [Candidatus Gottesmanbacteria bacterium]|nr:hypothetical protein [Candidatus Gottesmanbacteria bacterium]
MKLKTFLLFLIVTLFGAASFHPVRAFGGMKVKLLLLLKIRL